MGECIHGLENGVCDICFPAKPPAAPPTAERPAGAGNGTARSRTPGRAPARTARTPGRSASATANTASTGRSSAAKAASARHTVDVGEQRVYHVTHISNLAGILHTRALLADAGAERQPHPTVDISSPANREARRGMRPAGESEPPVAGYVPFFLSPNAGAWESVRSQSPDPRLSAEAYRHGPYDFVILVSTVKRVLGDAGQHDGNGGSGASVIVANGDPTGTFTRFGTSRDASERMLRALRSGEETGAMLAAELLVRDSFPLENVSLIGVANDKVRTAVRALLAASGTRQGPKVVVYPPWFQPGDSAAAGA